MNRRFRITVGSDLDHEELVGDLYFDDQIVCVLTREEGFEALQIEIFPAPQNARWAFAMKDFEEALAALKERMWSLRRGASRDENTGGP